MLKKVSQSLDIFLQQTKFSQTQYLHSHRLYQSTRAKEPQDALKEAQGH